MNILWIRSGKIVEVDQQTFKIYLTDLLRCLVIGGRKIELRAGEEFCIPRGVSHAGEVVAGTRTIHAFGGRRAERVPATSLAAD